MCVTYDPIWFNEIGLLVISYLCNSKSYNKYVAIYTKQEIFKGIQERKKLHTTYKEVIILGVGHFWLYLILFISETTKVRSNEIGEKKHTGRKCHKESTGKKSDLKLEF